MSRDQDLADYMAGVATLDELASADPALLALPGPDGGWSAAWVLHHLADAEVISATRLRRLLAEDHPALAGWDEEFYAGALAYDSRRVQDSVAVIESVRAMNLGVLAALTDEQWQRVGEGPNGPVTVADWLTGQVGHLREHLEQARAAANS